MKFLVLQAFSSNEYENANCDIGVIELTKELAQLVLARHKIFQKKRSEEGDLCTTTYWFHDIEFMPRLSSFLREENEADPFEDNGWVIIERDKSPVSDDGPAPAERTEMKQMILDEGKSVWWEALHKYADIQLSTSAVPFEEFEKML